MGKYKFGAFTIPATGEMTVSGALITNRLDVVKATITAHADNAGTIYVRTIDSPQYYPLQKGLSLELGRGDLAEITVSGAAGRVGLSYEQ